MWGGAKWKNFMYNRCMGARTHQAIESAGTFAHSLLARPECFYQSDRLQPLTPINLLSHECMHNHTRCAAWQLNVSKIYNLAHTSLDPNASWKIVANIRTWKTVWCCWLKWLNFSHCTSKLLLRMISPWYELKFDPISRKHFMQIGYLLYNKLGKILWWRASCQKFDKYLIREQNVCLGGA